MSPNNYNSDYLLPFVAKYLEIFDHIQEHKIPFLLFFRNPCQSDFPPDYYTKIILVKITNYIQIATSSGHFSALETY